MGIDFPVLKSRKAALLIFSGKTGCMLLIFFSASAPLSVDSISCVLAFGVLRCAKLTILVFFLLSCCSTDAECAVPMRAKVEAIAIANAFEGLIMTNFL